MDAFSNLPYRAEYFSDNYHFEGESGWKNRNCRMCSLKHASIDARNEHHEAAGWKAFDERHWKCFSESTDGENTQERRGRSTRQNDDRQRNQHYFAVQRVHRLRLRADQRQVLAEDEVRSQ